MSVETVITPAPTPLERLTELLMEKFGSLRCDHPWALVAYRGRLFLQCPDCGARTVGFRVYTPLRGGR